MKVIAVNDLHKILKNAYLFAANEDLSDVDNLEGRQSVTASHMREYISIHIKEKTTDSAMNMTNSLMIKKENIDLLEEYILSLIVKNNEMMFSDKKYPNVEDFKVTLDAMLDIIYSC